MNLNKKLITITTSIIMATSVLTGCSTSNTATSENIKKIGITQLVEHPSLDQTREGFLKALEDNGYKDGENIEIDYQNAQNDNPTSQTIANNFVNDKKDLIYAISTPSAQAALNATKDIPIIFTAVTDPVESGLVKSLNNNEGGNVSGTSDFISIEKNISLVEKLTPSAKKIAVIYSTSEVNSKVQVDSLKKYAKAKDLEVIEKGISSSSEINHAINSVINKADVLYVPTDNLVVSSMPIISKIANENNLPIIASDEGSVISGACACSGVDYFKLGYKSGEMAIKILSGDKKTSDLKIEMIEKTAITMNEDTMKTLHIEKPNDIDVKFVKTEN